MRGILRGCVGPEIKREQGVEFMRGIRERSPSYRIRCLFVVGLVLTGLSAQLQRMQASEHPISVIATDVYVSQTRVNARLRLFAEDLYLFQDIEANEFDVIIPSEIERAIEQHKDFLLERVIVRDSAGARLKGRVVSVEPFEIPIEGVEVGRLMEYSLTYQIEYPLETPPEFLTFDQEIVDPDGIFPSEMQLFLKQSGSETTFQTVLRPNEPYTTRFDWDAPPLSPEADEAAWEEWFNKQREETLGITSYGSIYSFLYITPQEVRHEILIPLGTLSTLFDIEREDKNFLEIEEQDRLKPKIEEFLRDSNPIRIDGIEVAPIFDRIDFYGLDLRDFAMQAERRKVSMANGRVGIILSYAAKTAPTNTQLTWDLFGPNIVSVQSAVFAYDETLKAKFSRFKDDVDNTFEWTDPTGHALPNLDEIAPDLPNSPNLSISIPSIIALGLIPIGLFFMWSRKAPLAGAFIFSAVLLGTAAATWNVGQVETSMKDPFASAPSLDDDYKDSVFRRLHANTYRAFDYRQETDIYDALAASVSGDLLRDLYLDIRRHLVVQSQGGAIARVQEVEILDDQIIEDVPSDLPWPGYQVECSWTVRGTVEHWGHIHERTYQYTGKFTIEPLEDAWKISDMELLDEQQISVKTGLRRF